MVATLYGFLSPAVEVNNPPASAKMNAGMTLENKKILAKLTALFSWMLLAEAS